MICSAFSSPYHCMTRRFCVRVVAGTPDRGVWRREILWYFSGLRGQRRIDLGGPGDDAAFGTLRGDACQQPPPSYSAASSALMRSTVPVPTVGPVSAGSLDIVLCETP